MSQPAPLFFLPSALAPCSVLKWQPSTPPNYSRYTIPELVREHSGSATFAQIEWQIPKATWILTLSTAQVLQHWRTASCCPSRGWEEQEEKDRGQSKLLLRQQWFLPQPINVPLLSAKRFKKCSHAPLSQIESASNWPANAKKSYYSKRYNLLQDCTQAGKPSRIRRIIPQLINYGHLLNGLLLGCATVSTGK